MGDTEAKDYSGDSDPDDDCSTDTDSEPESLMKKFDGRYSENYLKKKKAPTRISKEEETPRTPKVQLVSFSQEDLLKTHGESSTNQVQDVGATSKNKHIRVPIENDYEEVWRKWALDNIAVARGNIGAYNKARVFFFVHVAGFYGKNGGSGYGVLIRSRQGVPVAAYSHYDADKNRASPFCQELMAVNKGIDLFMELGLKYIQMVCTSTQAALAVSQCDHGEPFSQNDKTYRLTWEITRKLQTFRQKFEEDGDFGFHFRIFAAGKLQNTAARYLAKLEKFKGEMDMEELSKHDDLMHYIYKDATSLSDVRLFRRGF